MSFIPSKDDLVEAKEFIDKMTDNHGVALRVKMLIEQAEKVRKQERWIELLEKKYEEMRKELDTEGDYLPLDKWKHRHKDW